MKKNIKVYAGVWVDHSKAIVMNIQNDDWKIIKLKSEVPSYHRATSGTRGPLPYVFDGGGDDHKLKNRMHNAEKVFYKKIDKSILPNAKIFVIGPSLAKKELLKYLKEQKRKQIEIATSSKMTEKEFVAKVKKHFDMPTRII